VHALVAHGDAVGDGDGAELERVAARRVHAGLGRLRQPIQREVARRDLVPRTRDADLRLREVVVTQAYRAEHPSRGGGLETIGDLAAAGLDVHSGRGCAHGPRA